MTIKVTRLTNENTMTVVAKKRMHQIQKAIIAWSWVLANQQTSYSTFHVNQQIISDRRLLKDLLKSFPGLEELSQFKEWFTYGYIPIPGLELHPDARFFVDTVLNLNLKPPELEVDNNDVPK